MHPGVAAVCEVNIDSSKEIIFIQPNNKAVLVKYT